MELYLLQRYFFDSKTQAWILHRYQKNKTYDSLGNLQRGLANAHGISKKIYEKYIEELNNKEKVAIELKKIQYTTDFEYKSYSGSIVLGKRSIAPWIELKDVNLYKDKEGYRELFTESFVITKLSINEI